MKGFNEIEHFIKGWQFSFIILVRRADFDSLIKITLDNREKSIIIAPSLQVGNLRFRNLMTFQKSNN